MPRKNWLEWLVFAISAVAVVTVVWVLADAALERNPGPPELRVELGPPRSTGGVHTIPVRVLNEGPQTAEEVKIAVTLESGGNEVERAELVLQFVPAQSERKGFVSFREDPSCCTVSARPVSFESP